MYSYISIFMFVAGRLEATVCIEYSKRSLLRINIFPVVTSSSPQPSNYALRIRKCRDKYHPIVICSSSHEAEVKNSECITKRFLELHIRLR
jgi:hypothetical protein